LKTYYELLSIEPSAPADEIKKAFRREIARYHPDKVQHLGPEFQEIAATRAAELTEAYRILMEPDLRQKYDDAIKDGGSGGARSAPAAPASARTAEPQPAERSARPQPAPADTPVPETFRQTRATISDFVKKATLAKLRDAIASVFGDADALPVNGFDAAYATKARRGLFKKSEPPIRLLARIVAEVNGEAIQDAWPLALKAAGGDVPVCLLLMGSGMAPSRELSGTISELRRKSRGGGPVVIPVDVRDWEALFPAEAPSSCRSIIDRLKQAQ
jgi:hypothetical protein